MTKEKIEKIIENTKKLQEALADYSCDNCKEKNTCPFYEKGADECVYEIMAITAKGV